MNSIDNIIRQCRSCVKLFSYRYKKLLYLEKNRIAIGKNIDCLIATYCIAENHSLLHREADFDAFEEHLGLQVVHAGG